MEGFANTLEHRCALMVAHAEPFLHHPFRPHAEKRRGFEWVKLARNRHVYFTPQTRSALPGKTN